MKRQSSRRARCRHGSRSTALKDHVDVIVLVTGDSDFVPAMKFARREGARLVLFTLGHSVKEGMHEHADVVFSELPGIAPAQ